LVPRGQMLLSDINCKLIVLSIYTTLDSFFNPNDTFRYFAYDFRQNNHKLCNDTERFLKELNSSFLKELKALPSPEHESERRQRRVVLTRLANTFSNCLNEFQKAQTKASENDKNEVST